MAVYQLKEKNGNLLVQGKFKVILEYLESLTPSVNKNWTFDRVHDFATRHQMDFVKKEHESKF